MSNITLTEQIQAVEKEIMRLKHVVRRQERNGGQKKRATAAQLENMKAAAKTLRQVARRDLSELIVKPL